MSAPTRTAFNVFSVSAASLVQIINQFLFFSVLAAYYGASQASDALAAALVLPSVLAAIISGSLAYVLVPELVAKFEDDGQQRAGWQLAFYVGIITVVISGAISISLLLAAEPVCGWLYDDMAPDDRAQTVRLLKILSVQVVLLSLISWAQSVFHSRHQFVLPALGGVLGTALGLVLAMQQGHRDIAVFAWAINLGGLVSVLIHLVPLATQWTQPKADQASLWRLALALAPLLLGAAFIRLDPLVDRVLASELDSGSIAHVNYAQRIMAALLAVGTSSLSVIAFPQLAQQLTASGKEGMASYFALAFRRLVLLVVPIAMGFSVFSVRIISDLLQRGEFTSEDSRVVGLLVVALMGMFAGASSGELLARGFYVLGDTKTPTIVGVIMLVIGLTAKVVMFKFIGIWGIAAGVSGYFLLSAFTMACILAARVGPRIFAGALPYALQAILSASAACGCSALVYGSGLDRVVPFGLTWLAGPAGALVYAMGLLALRNTEMWQLVDVVRGKLTRKV